MKLDVVELKLIKEPAYLRQCMDPMNNSKARENLNHYQSITFVRYADSLKIEGYIF